MRIQIGRRQLLRQATGLAALSTTLPSFLHKTSLALDGDPQRAISPIPGLRDDRVLVVVQLAGGNDGLNTLVPYFYCTTFEEADGSQTVDLPWIRFKPRPIRPDLCRLDENGPKQP